MTDWPHLRNAPIIEGLLDIQFEPLPSERLPDLQRFHDMLPDYPQQSPRVAFAGQIAMSATADVNVSHQSGVIGYQFGDGRRVFQARLNGVTLSLLAPYSLFSELEAEAKRLWALFTEHIHPGRVLRIALRYINRLALPLPLQDFKEYILTIPDIAPGVPQNLAAFQMRLFIPDSESPALAIVTEGFDGVQHEAREAIVILDIDVFRTASETTPIQAFEIWPIVLELRDFKNRIFFGTITDKLKELYE